MWSLSAIALLSMASAAFGQTTGVAKITTDNPEGAKYVAEFTGDIEGTARAGSDPFGIGVSFHVELTGLPEADGPFGFHLHQLPVPEDGNCTGTGGHLDPYGRGTEPKCDASAPATCEVGDLSGKYGALKESSSTANFLDLYSSLNPEEAAFFGNRSFVIHNAAGDRIACASFNPVEDEAQEADEETDDCEG